MTTTTTTSTSVARGPVGTPSRPATQIILTIVTLGIWSLVWIYRQHKELKDYSGEGMGGPLAVVLSLVIFVVAYFSIPAELAKVAAREGTPTEVSAKTGWWFLLPIVGTVVWYLKVQAALNDFWVARGAQPA